MELSRTINSDKRYYLDMSDYETVKMKHFFQKERRKKYLCTAVCIAAAAFILSISLIWSIVHKNMNNHLDNHPLLILFHVYRFSMHFRATYF